MEPRHDRSDHRPSRRAFLGAAAAAGALAWVPVFRAAPASAQATSSPPANFPATISVYQQAYQNWSGMIVIDDVWTCAPTSASEVVTLANWAHANGYRLRAKGMSHGWSPLVLPEGSTGAGYVLVDTTQYLTSATISAGTPATIAAVSAGQAAGDGWSTAVSILTEYDPNGVFSNPFLDTLFG